VYREDDQKAVNNIVVTKGLARVTGSSKTGSCGAGNCIYSFVTQSPCWLKPCSLCGSYYFVFYYNWHS
jgi:hypothetical protein